MIKYFCDTCGEEIPAQQLERFEGHFGKLYFAILTGLNAIISPKDHFCWSCIAKAVAEEYKRFTEKNPSEEKPRKQMDT